MIPTAAKLEQRDVQRSGIAKPEHEAILFQALTEGQAALLISCAQARVCAAGRNRRGEERGSFKCKRNAWHGVDTYMREAACSRYVNDTGSWFVEAELTLLNVLRVPFKNESFSSVVVVGGTRPPRRVAEPPTEKTSVSL